MRSRSHSAQTLAQLLEIADDARIEGRRSIVDPDAIIETVGTFAAYHPSPRECGRYARGDRHSAAHARFRSHSCAVQCRRLTEHFRHCLDFVKHRAQGGQGTIPRWAEDQARMLLETQEHEVSANNFAMLSALTTQQRRAVLAEMENARRLTVLAGELSEQLSRIAPGERTVAAIYENRHS